MQRRHYSTIDQLLFNVDAAIRTLTGTNTRENRESPAKNIDESADLTKQDKKLSGRLMRINHAGEVSAQGLYQGQALTAKLPRVRTQMEQAAAEENEHLSWCRTRAKELGSSTSIFDPVWYVGSLTLGAAAGLAGDKWSLGFVAETEKQVVKHLDEHLKQISPADKKSRAILEQMRIDEGQHATNAQQAGGADLPKPVKSVMRLMSKVMTQSTYWF